MNRQTFFTGRKDEGPMVRAMETDETAAGTPVIPLPNPGQGGPVADGNTDQGNEGGATPVIPLPNPGEGGPVADLDDPPSFRPILPGGSSSSSVTIIPGITFPCFSCGSGNFGRVRFLNAASGYEAFHIYLGNWLIARRLGNGSMTTYLQAASGAQTVTLAGSNGYIYLQKQIQVRAGSAVTVAIINTESGLDLMEISDISCSAPSSTSCLRVCNLSLNLGPFDVSAESGGSTYTPFTNVRYREITPYTSFYPGWYQLYIARTGAYPNTYVAAATANMRANTSYTLYIFNADNSTDGLKTMIVSN